MIIIELIYNLAILVAISIVSGFVGQQWKNRRREFFLQGIIFGTAAVIGMMRPLVLMPGLIFDGRSVMISLCGLFFGPIAASIAAGMAVIYRITGGGIGTFTGISVILFSALTGIFFYYRITKPGKKISALMLLIFGFIVHIGMVTLMFTLPFNIAVETVKNISLPVLLTYPVITVLIGKVLSAQEEKRQYLENLSESALRLNKSQEMAHLGSWEFDRINRELVWSDEIYRIIGLKPGEIKPSFQAVLDAVHPDDRALVDAAYFDSRQKNIDSSVVDHRIIRKNTNEIRFIHQKFENLKNADGEVTRILGMAQDVTDRKQSAEKIEKLLVDKELLLREVHHRIKNNMSTMMGLLSLQADLAEDREAAKILETAKNRMQGMAVLYDKLYRSDNFRTMSVKDYIPSLVNEIVEIFPNKNSVNIKTDIENFIVDVNILSPLGIILNELITNAMKYAFNHKSEKNNITISVFKKDSTVALIVDDNGSGFPESYSPENSSGFGLKLVGMLVKQIRGSMKIEHANGTRIAINFEI